MAGLFKITHPANIKTETIGVLHKKIPGIYRHRQNLKL